MKWTTNATPDISSLRYMNQTWYMNNRASRACHFIVPSNSVDAHSFCYSKEINPTEAYLHRRVHVRYLHMRRYRLFHVLLKDYISKFKIDFVAIYMTDNAPTLLLLARCTHNTPRIRSTFYVWYLFALQCISHTYYRDTNYTLTVYRLIFYEVSKCTALRTKLW